MTTRELVLEFRRAVRSLVRSPGFTVAAVLTLGVGLGATAAIFTLVDRVLLRPLPFPEAGRLVRVYHTFTDPGASGSDWPLARFEYPYFEQESRAFEAFGGYWSPDRVILTGDGVAERVMGVQTTPSLLDLLGARAVAGRLYTVEDAEEAAGGMVLGHALWQRRYGGDPSVVGRTITVDGTTREVLGVMAEGVHLPAVHVDLWLPYVVPPAVRPDDAFRIHVLARLAEGVGPEVAQADLDGLNARLPELASWFTTYLDDQGLRTRVRSLRQEVVGSVERALWLLLGAVGILLLVAAANVANLYLLRTEGRRREVAVRSALGAGRTHLVAHFLSESVVVAVAAGAVGLGLAHVGVESLVSLAPPSIPRLDELSLGWPTVAVAALLSLLLALLLGLWPLARFGRGSAAPAGQGARATGDRGGTATGNGLVVAQVALALVLLAGSGLLSRSFRNLRAVDPGFDPGGVLVTELSLASAGYESGEAVDAFYRRLLERTEALPGVRRASLGPSPVQEVFGCSGLYQEGVVLREGEFGPCVPMVFVGAAYWEVLGIPLREGRGFEDADASASPVVVVTEGLARRLWPDGSPIGRGVHPAPRKGPPWYPVAGVSGDVRGRGPDQPATEVMYFPIVHRGDDGGTRYQGTTELLVRTAEGIDPTSLAPALRSLIAELDPNVALTVRGTLEDEVSRTMVRTSFTLSLLGMSAVMALILGLVGLYGVVAYRVGSRRREIGIRMAMGARAGEVRGMVLAHSMRLVALGLALGWGTAAVVTRLMDSLLHEVEPGDPWMLALAAFTLAATALAASWVPAQRATRVDPSEALRTE